MRRALFALVICMVLLAIAASCMANQEVRENRIDVLRADAPELAAYGNHALGVRTLDFVNLDQIDILQLDPKLPKPDPMPRYDRPITVEVWYPADPQAKGSTVLKAPMRNPKIIVDLQGKAIRDASPEKTTEAFPLVIISHGYPGNRFLMSPIAENIASKGYVVVSIDHTDSTYSTFRNKLSFSSTLVNRPLDQLFVLDQITRLSQDPGSFLNGLANTDNVALIGYSMGAYGTTVTVGASLTQKAVDAAEGFWSAPHGTLAIHQSGSESHKAMFDPRIKTAITFGVAGTAVGFFDQESLKEIKVPLLFIGGSVDDIVDYKNGIRPTWEGATHVDRALLTFVNANHNAGAPMPPPQEANRFDKEWNMNLANHYIDAVWDNVRMNNVSQHFITAWLGKYLNSDSQMEAYLNLVPESNEGVWAMDKDGNQKPEHTYWKGFPNRTAKGLRFETLHAGE